MEEASEFGHWDELIPEILWLIFRRLPLEEILKVLPCVCKGWNRAVNGPYCWQEIDIEEWSSLCQQSGHIDRMVRMLIHRSGGSLQKLSVSCLQNDSIFSFIAEHAGSLKTLKVQKSKLSNSVVVNVAEKLSSLTSLDLSYCCEVGPEAIQAIGENCKSLTEFYRNMNQVDVQNVDSHEDVAHAIATSMPNLKRLEIPYHKVSTEGVLEVLSNCRFLEFLDIYGCWEVEIDKMFLKEKCPGLEVCGPHDWEDGDEDGDSDHFFSDDSEYMEQLFSQEVDLDMERLFWQNVDLGMDPNVWRPWP